MHWKWDNFTLLHLELSNIPAGMDKPSLRAMLFRKALVSIAYKIALSLLYCAVFVLAKCNQCGFIEVLKVAF